MKTFKGILTIVIVLAILAGSILGMRAISAARSDAFKASAGPQNDSVTVRTGIVGRADMRNELVFNGDVEALRTVDVQPKVTGRLKSLALADGTFVEEGVQVKAGQLIAQIDDREFQAKLDSAKAGKAVAEAAVAAAKASLQQLKASQESSNAATASAKASLEDARRELTRQQDLFKSKATTRQSLDQAETAALQAEAMLQQRQAEESAAAAKIVSGEAEVKKAEAAVLQAEAALEEAQLDFDETRIYSPMDGVVSEAPVDAGCMVSPSTTIVTIMELSTVKVLISIPVNYLPYLKPGVTKATLRVEALPGKDVACVIEKIYPAVNPVTRTAQAEIRVANTYDGVESVTALRSGMYASVALLLEEHDDVVVVDATLPVRSMSDRIVYLCDGDKVKAVSVKLGISYEGKVEVLEGLQAGQEIVVEGQHRLTDGAAITRVAPIDKK